MRYRRYKLAVSIPAVVSTVLFALGILAILFSYLKIHSKGSGHHFLIQMNPLDAGVFLLLLIIGFVFLTIILKRK